MRPALKISKVEVFPVSVPLRTEFRNAHLTRSVQESIIVRARTDDGLYGIGNIDPDPGYSEESFAETLGVLREKFASAVIGMDPLNIVAVLRHMDRLISGFLDAKAAIEMAFFDLKGKVLGVPVHSLLGGAVRRELSLNGWIGLLAPEEAAREGLAWRERGFRSVKVKVGSGIESDLERVRAIREAVGRKLALRVDANEAYTAEDAIRLGKALEPWDIALFEQPVHRRDLEGMARVRRGIAMPVMADEAVLGPETLIEIIRKDAADIVKLKVMKQGGLLRTAQMIQTAEAAGISCVIGHGFGLAVNTLAEIHVAATSENVLEGCEFVGPLKIRSDVATAALDMERGRVAVPTEGGLGCDLDEARLRAFALP